MLFHNCLHCGTMMPHNYGPDEDYKGDLVLAHVTCSHCEQHHVLLLRVGGYPVYQLDKAENSPVHQSIAAK